MKKLIFIICFILLFPTLGLTTNRYVTCAGGATSTDHDGTSGSEYVSIDDILLNSSDFADGDDLYFLNGSTCNGSSNIEGLDIKGAAFPWEGDGPAPPWNGTDAVDWSIIGCYTSIGAHTCATKPKIQTYDNVDGSGTGQDYSDNNGITLGGLGYFQIQDLDIRNTTINYTGYPGQGSTGISFDNADEKNLNTIRVLRCNFYHWNHYAVAPSFAGPYSIIKDNTAIENGNAFYPGGEGSQASSYMLVSGNTCTTTWGYIPCFDRDNPKDGICDGVEGDRLDGHCVALQSSTYSIIEDNISYDAFSNAFTTQTVGTVALTDVAYNVFRNNQSYDQTSDLGSFVFLCNYDGDPDCKGNMAYQNIITDDRNKITSDAATPRVGIKIMGMAPITGENSIFNNTYYNAAEAGIGTREVNDYVVLLNNIVVTDGLTSNENWGFYFKETIGSGSNRVVDNNLYWAVTGDPSTYDYWRDDSTAYTWTEWKALGATWDDNSPAPADPLFTDAAFDIFTLTSISPAIDKGGFISNVTAAGSGTTITVANPYRFHGNFGLRDENGDLIDGMLVSFYHGTLRQDVEILSVNYGTATLTLDQSITTIYSGSATDPDTTTQIALRFIGTAPDIGANEYAGAPPAATAPFSGVSCQGCKLN